MTDTRKEFEEWFLSQYGVHFKYAELQFDHAPETNFAWKACQSLNDKRIQQLLAVIAKKDEALKLSAAVFSGEISDKSGMIKSLEILRDSLSIKPENVELVEVGGFVMHEDKLGTRYPSSQMSYNYDEFEIGALNKLYTIKQK